MNKIFYVTAAACLFASGLAEDQVEAEENAVSNVFDLTSESFYEMVVDKETKQLKGDKPWFIKFYAPWCGHCKRLAPTWEEFAGLHNDQVNVAKIDCTQHLDVCKDHGVRGYPTLNYFSGDQYYKFQGKRDMIDLEAFALGEGYLTAEHEEVPMPVKGMAAWGRFAVQTGNDLAREIDNMFVSQGLTWVPREARYALVTILCMSPLLILCCFLMFCDGDESAGPEHLESSNQVKPKEGVSPRKREKVE